MMAPGYRGAQYRPHAPTPRSFGGSGGAGRALADATVARGRPDRGLEPPQERGVCE